MDCWDRMTALASEMGVRIRFKDESILMRMLALLLFFNKDFATSYTTTLGSVVFFPSRAHVARDRVGYALVLAHELTHVQDSRDQGFVRYSLSYLMPQVLAVLSLLSLSAIWIGWWGLSFLAFLAFLAPVASPGRARIEFRGYATTMACMVWGGWTLRNPPSWIGPQFWGPAYYWMDRDAGHVEGCLRGWLAKIDSGAILDELPLARKLKAIFEEARPWVRR